MFALSSSTIYGWKTVVEFIERVCKHNLMASFPGNGDRAIDNIHSPFPSIRIHGKQGKSSPLAYTKV